MKITKIDVMQVDIKHPRSAGWRPIVCRVYTDEGIYGDGEAALTYCDASSAAFGMIKDLARLVIGMDPLDNEIIWDKLYKSTFWGQNGGPVIFSGISAIDIALWDIKGKYFKVPIYKLLGGKFRDNIRCYASQLQFGWGPEFKVNYKLEDYVETAKKAIADGYDAVKIDFFTYDELDGHGFDAEERTRLLAPRYVNMVERRIAAVREAIGPDADIIMENHSFIDSNGAVQLGRVAQKYNIFYYEEPNTPDPKMTKYICDKLQMPIAHGERIYSRWQYAKYYENNSVQVIQPDIGNCGGLTEAKKICDMAYVYDVSVQAHVCASPLSTAVALHLEAAIPNFVIHEHHVFNLHDYNKQLAVKDLQPINGKYKIPEEPGIGNELSDFCFKNTLAKVTVE